MAKDLRLTKTVICETKQLTTTPSVIVDSPVDYRIENILVHAPVGQEFALSISLQDKLSSVIQEVDIIDIVSAKSSQSVMGLTELALKDPHENYFFNVSHKKRLMLNISGVETINVLVTGGVYD